jgi:heme/copper-type cytochrome/quinol oxidase subunit 4
MWIGSIIKRRTNPRIYLRKVYSHSQENLYSIWGQRKPIILFSPSIKQIFLLLEWAKSNALEYWINLSRFQAKSKQKERPNGDYSIWSFLLAVFVTIIALKTNQPSQKNEKVLNTLMVLTKQIEETEEMLEGEKSQTMDSVYNGYLTLPIFIGSLFLILIPFVIACYVVLKGKVMQ